MKQVILVRKDLKMPFGKACAQVAHASIHAVLRSSRKLVDEWISEGGKKVVLEVDNLEELKKYHSLARKAKFAVALIEDAGKTVFKKPTVTCLGIGPDDEDRIDAVTGKLKML